MDEALRYTALALTALVCALLLKKAEPTAATAVSLIAAVTIGAAAITAFSVVIDFARASEPLLQGAEGVVPLLLKVLATVLVTGFGAQACRDCGEGTLAMQLEFFGGVLAFVQVLPLLNGVFSMLRAMAGLV